VSAGKLVPVLERFAPTAPGVFLYYPGHRQIPPKLRAFIDHVKRHAPARDPPRGRDDTARRRSRKRG
jgi:DNA-binding transcriptional LysR family regulator